MPQRRPSAPGREQDGVLVDAHVLRVHDFVALPVFQHAVLVNARRVGKGVAPHNGLVGLDGHVHEVRHQAARGVNLLRVDLRVDAQVAVAFQNHGHLLKRGVARPLADAVDGDLHLPRPVEHARHGVGRGHAQVVVAVGGQHGAVYAVHVLHEVLYLLAVLLRQAVTRGVGNVHHRRARLDDGLHDARQILIVRAPGILAVKFHVVHVAFGVLHGGHGAFQYLVLRGVELVADVVVRRADARVYALVLGISQGFGGHVDVLLHTAREGANHRPGHGFGYLDHGVEVAGTRNGEARLNHVHAEGFQRACHLDFLHRVQLAAGHLLAVAQRRVKYKKSVHRDY